ncbi:hypothetical protein [Alicyclobacillus dauci]|uniref:DUF4064 domain-containing protein n=1 Tax=Alicyclobacillus dauci TaxID=1475485 RepID=A0ABY6Z6C2_9BACL|nr:hypothetical protein [Alicyclobacillus dauci]WAH38218.1 hypothetical protein NZD86_06985 [Alicyclobacillus dauci]
MIALLLGLVGGIIGIVETVLNIAYGSGNTPSVNVHAIGAILFSVVGVVGSLLARKVPRVAGVVMLVGAVGGFILATFSFIPPGVLLLLAGLIAVFTSNDRKPSLDD